MIKTFIFVEDGSVDFDALQRTVGDETKVIVYRQGASSPEIKQPEFPISTFKDKSYEATKTFLKKFCLIK